MVTNRSHGCARGLVAGLLVTLAVILVACFDINSLTPFPCATDLTCPSQLTCLDQQCVQACVPGMGSNDCRATCTSLMADYCPSVNNCVDLEADDDNCGACGRKCTNGTACVKGACVSDLTLGKTCGSDSECPASAPTCANIALPGGQATKGYCTLTCLQSGNTTTDSNGDFNNSIGPPPDDSICRNAYDTDASGTPDCALVMSWTPMDSTPKPNKMYSISMGCLIRCGAGNACAFGMTCNSTIQACVPL